MNLRSDPAAHMQHFSNRNRTLRFDTGYTPIYDQDPFAPLASQGAGLIIFICSRIQKGGQSGMTACSADSVIIGAYARAAIAQNRPPEKALSRARLTRMHDPDPHPL